MDNKVKSDNKVKTDNKAKFDLIITVINRGFSDYIVDAARNSGASGATILYARSANPEDEQKFLGINIHPEKELVLILVLKKDKVRVMKKIIEQTQIEQTGRGLCFSVPVNDIAGIKHLLKTKPKKSPRRTRLNKIG